MDAETVVTDLDAGGQVLATTWPDLAVTRWDWRAHPDLIWRPIDHTTYLALLSGDLTEVA